MRSIIVRLNRHNKVDLVIGDFTLEIFVREDRGLNTNRAVEEIQCCPAISRGNTETPHSASS